MRKRKFITLLSVVLIASVALFTGLAQAQAPVPDLTCNLVNKDGSDSGYTLTREANAPPVPTAKQTWRYAINGFSGTQFAVVVSNPWPIPTDYTWNSSENWVLQELPAEQLSNNWDGFGQWASGSPQKLLTFTGTGKTTFEFYTDKVLPDTFMPVQLKKGRDFLYCSISGPGWPETPPRLASLQSTCENILSGIDNNTGASIPLTEPFSIKTIIDELTCELNVTVYSGLDCITDPTNVPASTMALDFGGTLAFDALECGSENQRCGICELRGHRNPCSYTKYSAGRPYTVCYDCNTGERVSCN